MFQSLLYWISYSYIKMNFYVVHSMKSFNPYYTGFPILIPMLFLQETKLSGFNPYYTGFPILICLKMHT